MLWSASDPLSSVTTVHLHNMIFLCKQIYQSDLSLILSSCLKLSSISTTLRHSNELYVVLLGLNIQKWPRNIHKIWQNNHTDVMSKTPKHHADQISTQGRMQISQCQAGLRFYHMWLLFYIQCNWLHSQSFSMTSQIISDDPMNTSY